MKRFAGIHFATEGTIGNGVKDVLIQMFFPLSPLFPIKKEVSLKAGVCSTAVTCSDGKGPNFKVSSSRGSSRKWDREQNFN